MAKVTKAIIDKTLRDQVFEDLMTNYSGDEMEFNGHSYKKINDRQWGVIITDANGEQRYIRIGAIVAELREDMTAEELMRSEIEAYEEKQAAKAEKAKAKAEKIEKDKAKRAAEKAKEEQDDPNQFLPHEVTY